MANLPFQPVHVVTWSNGTGAVNHELSRDSWPAVRITETGGNQFPSGSFPMVSGIDLVSEINRLEQLIDVLRIRVQTLEARPTYIAPMPRPPLTEQQIAAIVEGAYQQELEKGAQLSIWDGPEAALVRAVEKIHGIGGKP